MMSSSLLREGQPSTRAVFWFFVLAFVVLAAGIGLRAPWPADEPRFVLVARQMWESGDWWFPHRGQELYSDKPPLYFWLLCASYAVFRDWDWAYLWPSLVAAMATLWLTWDFARRLWTPRAGLWAMLGVLCTFQFVYQGKRAQIDPTVVAFITLGVYGIGRHVLLGPAWRWYWLGCFAAGLGVISKGVGFLALLALLPYFLMRWRGWQGLAEPAPRGAGRWWLGAGAFLLAIGMWFVPMLSLALLDGDAGHRAYLDDLLFRQTATRYVSAWHHHKPGWYFVEVVLLYWLPFSAFLPWLLRPWREAWRARDARVWWPLAWALLVFVFFSASPGKRDMYILPALPMVAVAAAPYLEALSRRAGLRWLLFGLVLAMGLGFAVAGGMAALGDPKFAVKFEAERGLQAAGAHALWWSMAALGALLCVLAAWLRPRRAAVLALTMNVAVWLFYALALAPMLDDENSGRGLMQAARAHAGPKAVIGLVDWREQLLLQADGPVAEFGFRVPADEQWRRGIAWLGEPSAVPRVLLGQGSDAMPACLDRRRLRSLGAANRRDWWLVDRDAVRDCEGR